MPTATTATTVNRLLAWTLAGLTSLGSPALRAQNEGGGPSANTAAAWRASSRLGYAPTAASAQAAQASPRAWALQQIDAAHAASLRPPVLPAELARINAPLNDIARDFQKIVDDYVRSHYGAGGAAAAKKTKADPIKAAV